MLPPKPVHVPERLDTKNMIGTEICGAVSNASIPPFVPMPHEPLYPVNTLGALDVRSSIDVAVHG